ncbi:MAG TPA: aryl-sulfate sulfotransferase [Polyangia bacterium]|nr:aryl-sulfate sulfotransferase [Polyangia bacterium]
MPLAVLALAGCGRSGGAGPVSTSGVGVVTVTDGGADAGATCTIAATVALSPTMPTVAVVTWSTSWPDLTAAEIDFGPAAGGPRTAAPVDLGQPGYRTLLLGMKPSSDYLFRIVARDAAGTCTGEEQPLRTGALSGAPKVTATVADAAAHDRGFIVTSTGLPGKTAFIIDADGAVVWSFPGPAQPSRAHLSWDGSHLYAMALNVENDGTGEVQSVAMDGTDAVSLGGLAAAHHDLTAIPGGFATLLWNGPGIDAPCSLVERADATGALTTVVADMGRVYNSKTFHTNSVHYYPGDDSYTVGDRNPALFVKLTRAGGLLWQFGGGDPKDPSKFFAGVPAWTVNHGHQLLADGTFVFFDNGGSEAWAYALDPASLTARQIFDYTASGAVSQVLGDVQRLPNGNYLVTFSTSGQIHEVSPSGALVAEFTSPSFGYAEFRESLYGPPPY